MEKRRMHLTESQLYGLINTAIQEERQRQITEHISKAVAKRVTNYINESDDNTNEKQQLLSYVSKVMRDTFKTSVWEMDYEAVPIIEEGESEARDYCADVSAYDNGKVFLYDAGAGAEWKMEDLDIYTIQCLAKYMQEKENEAKSKGIVDGIQVSNAISGMVLPYRVIGDLRIVPSAAHDIISGGRNTEFVSANVFYYDNDDEVMASVNNTNWMGSDDYKNWKQGK